MIDPMRADKCPAEGRVVELGTAVVVEGWLDHRARNEVAKWAKGGTSALGPQCRPMSVSGVVNGGNGDDKGPARAHSCGKYREYPTNRTRWGGRNGIGTSSSSATSPAGNGAGETSLGLSKRPLHSDFESRSSWPTCSVILSIRAGAQPCTP